VQSLKSIKQKGVALITVLFLLALATVIVSGLVTLLNTNIQRSSSTIESEQAYLLCLSGEEWARQLLAEDYKSNPVIDHTHEKWAEGHILKIDNGYAEISIQDAQGKFNINNLNGQNGVTNPDAKLVFQKLIDEALADSVLSKNIADEMADWIDVDNTTGVEEADYLAEPIPYRPPNSNITDISEIRWLLDVDQDIYKVINRGLFPSLVALPEATRVNINTATPEVIAALGNDITRDEAAGIVQAIRSKEDGFTANAAKAQFPLLGAADLVEASDYYEVKVRAKFADHYAFLTTILKRDHKANGEISIISRDRSGRFIFPFSKDYNGKGNSKDYEFEI
jgi:general secretion pathway protein K